MTEAEELELLELEAEAAQASVSPPSGREQGGAGEALARGAGQGATAGMADEATGLLQASQGPGTPWWMTSPIAMLAEATSGVPAEQRAAAAEMPDLGQGGFGDRYRQARDSERALNEQAKEEHPVASFVGQALGGLPLAIATAGAGAPTLARSALQGAGLGAVSGAGGSEADATQGGLGQMLLDALAGGVLGGAAGAAGYGLTKALAGPGAELLRRLGITQGRKVLTGGTKSISQAAAVSDEAVERALQEGAIKPLGTTAGASERLGVLREGAAKAYREAVEALEAAGVVGPERDALARAMMDKALRERANSLGSAVPGYMEKLAREMAQKPGVQVPGEMAQRVGSMGEVIEEPVERLGLTQAENIKRALQDQAKKEYTKVAGNTQLGQAKMSSASQVRQAIEDAVEAQAGKAPDAAAAFVPTKQRLGNLIEADEAALKALNSAQNKNSVSLRDLLVAGLAPGGPVGQAVTLPLSMLFRAFGPSTTAAGAYGLGSALPGLAPGALPAALTLEQAIMELLRQKEQEAPVGP